MSKTMQRWLALFFLVISAPALAWYAADTPDQMTGKTTYAVYVQSKNSVLLSPPYGKISAKLQLRNHPRYGKDVIFAADEGQISCHSWSPCSVLVRVDDKSPIKFQGSNPSDGSSEIVFLRPVDRFVKALNGAKTVRIEVEFYRNGNQSFLFDVANFDGAMLASPKRH